MINIRYIRGYVMVKRLANALGPIIKRLGEAYRLAAIVGVINPTVCHVHDVKSPLSTI